jgi:DNA-3-methyladenine glycosylase I
MARAKTVPLDPHPPTAPRSASKKRCFWAESDPLLAVYHDEEWGVPVHDDRQWFEKLVLDGAQAGLSWLTILRKRQGYREAFVGFDPRRVAKFSDDDVERLMLNPAIVRNRAKIRSAIGNAKAFLLLQKAEGSFDAFIWRFVGGKPLQGRRRDRTEVPARTELSDELSRELRARGFSFVGTTILYAFMQAAGLVNDHIAGCHRSAAIARLGRQSARPR